MSAKREHLEKMRSIFRKYETEAEDIGKAWDDNEIDLGYQVRQLYLMLENDCRLAGHVVDLLLEHDDDELPEIREK